MSRESKDLKEGAGGRSLRFLEGLKALGESFWELCFPRRCAGCEETWLGSRPGFWCDECLKMLPWIASPLCPRCGRPYLKSPASLDHLCGDCQLSTLHFDSARSATLYTGVVRERIHQLKFGAQLKWALPLADLLETTFKRHCEAQIDLILPVPLHLKRLRSRGFNQAGIMARTLGKRVGVPVRFDVLQKPHWTDPQTRLNRTERLENVKGAFGIALPEAVKGRSILLIDDVFTTGTTVGECAKTVRRAGAREVHILTVARALPEVKRKEEAAAHQEA